LKTITNKGKKKIKSRIPFSFTCPIKYHVNTSYSTRFKLVVLSILFEPRDLCLRREMIISFSPSSLLPARLLNMIHRNEKLNEAMEAVSVVSQTSYALPAV